MRWLSACALVILAVGGCSIGVQSTPTASSVPATPTGGPLPTCGCTAGPHSPDPAFEVLLRMSVSGGLAYPGITVLDPPVFSLYGDGSVVYTEDRLDNNVHDVQLWQARLTQAQSDALLADALDTADLRNARDSYPDAGVFDAQTSTFEVHANGVDKIVDVYALGFPAGVPAADAAARVRFARLADRLDSFGSEVRSGKAEDLGKYVPAGYVLMLHGARTDQTVNATWPWPGLTLGDFKPINGMMAMLSQDATQGEAVTQLGIRIDLVATAPDGLNYVISVLPLVRAPSETFGL